MMDVEMVSANDLWPGRVVLAGGSLQASFERMDGDRYVVSIIQRRPSEWGGTYPHKEELTVDWIEL